jgi:hypothetical protein
MGSRAFAGLRGGGSLRVAATRAAEVGASETRVYPTTLSHSPWLPLTQLFLRVSHVVRVDGLARRTVGG